MRERCSNMPNDKSEADRFRAAMKHLLTVKPGDIDAKAPVRKKHAGKKTRKAKR